MPRESPPTASRAIRHLAGARPFVHERSFRLGDHARATHHPEVLAHLARLGGMIVTPTATLTSLAGGEGDSREVFLWGVLVAAAASPVRFGQAILLARVDLVAGLLDLARTLAERFGGALVGCIVAASVAWLFERRRAANRIGIDRLFDIATFMLVPHFILISAGVILAKLGIELWFLPHRLPKGSVAVVAIRVAVAYAWSVGLFALFLKLRAKGSKEPA